MKPSLAFLILFAATVFIRTAYADDRDSLPYGFIEPKKETQERLSLRFLKRNDAEERRYLFSIEPGCVVIDVKARRIGKQEIEIEILDRGKFVHFHPWARKRLGISGNLFKLIYKEVEPIVDQQGNKFEAALHELVEIKELHPKKTSEKGAALKR